MFFRNATNESGKANRPRNNGYAAVMDPANGAIGMSDPAAAGPRWETVSKCGQRASFKLCVFILALLKNEPSLCPSAPPRSILCSRFNDLTI